jgi:hypothetical protein
MKRGLGRGKNDELEEALGVDGFVLVVWFRGGLWYFYSSCSLPAGPAGCGGLCAREPNSVLVGQGWRVLWGNSGRARYLELLVEMRKGVNYWPGTDVGRYSDGFRG